ncbi:hypothetical protein DMB66_47225 [Actinoplanes sp. ATCC 53533]|uniref:hypothetical protein n=1 Tax=Actinoplanes sp. ATCC 53533 TaxID=1288362 RepID=UPI000F7941D4|nr:hypothetical protein [Actinoplanes sp. ATCC 53533]RSM47975.1 hypothetical protein DMB66_47225 [Actinoplanes sp. ATCC 53533]
MADVRDFDAAQGAAGRLELLAVVGSPATVWRRAEISPGGSWTGWEALGDTVGPFDEVNVDTAADGRLAAVVKDAVTGTVLHASEMAPGGPWSAWTSLDTPPGRPGHLHSLSVYVTKNRTRTVLVGKDDGRAWGIWQRRELSGVDWSEWAELSRPLVWDEGGPTAVTAALNIDGPLEVFALVPGMGTVTIWHCWQPAPDDMFSEWEPIGDSGPVPGNGTPGRPVIYHDVDYQLGLLVTSGGSMYHCWQAITSDPESWTAWHDVSAAGVLLGTPAAVRELLYPGVTVVAPGAGNGGLWQRQRESSGAWTAWTAIRGSESSAYDRVRLSWGIGRILHLFARNVDGSLHLYRRPPAGDWSFVEGWPEDVPATGP